MGIVSALFHLEAKILKQKARLAECYTKFSIKGFADRFTVKCHMVSLGHENTRTSQDEWTSYTFSYRFEIN